ILYLVMSAILVHPTFDMNVVRPTTDKGRALVAAMEEVGSPIGLPYIRPILVDWHGEPVVRQVIAVEDRDGIPTAVQHFGLIDSNLVKNFRNRLTAAALRLWNGDLADAGMEILEVPWLAQDVPYTVYFGLALLPLAASLAASVLGAILTAQEFELGTIMEYRLAPAAPLLVLTARLVRLVISALLAAGILLVAVGSVTGAWPSAVWLVGLVLTPVALIAGCLGTLAGLLLRKVIPAFLVGLVASFVGWLLGSAFGLAAGFGTGYALVSRLTPGTHAVELIFPRYYGIVTGQPLISAAVLVALSAVMLLLTVLAYRWRVVRQG
ncbi:MAG: ABC transporter permease, partial [Anaerolineae bacterium]